ncbi:MAG: ABC transporter ATP-binding protein [Parazoarcus communis]
MICIDKLVYRYRSANRPALDGVSLQIAPGSLFGLLGPNGAGKTTLISLLSGLLSPHHGSIRIRDTALTDFRRTYPNAIALVPQDHAFYPMLTVAENLAFFAGVQGLDRRAQASRSAAAIEFARLEGVTRQLAGELSGGLRRRLNLAIGLLADPDILLLDEPTVGVDPQSRHFLLDAIRTLAKHGKTIIYTSHYMEEVEALCDDIAIIDHGRVLTHGSLATLLADDAPSLHLRLPQPLPATLAHTWATRHASFTTCGNEVTLAPVTMATLPRILAELAGAGLAPLGLSLGERNLEQRFMQLTQRSLRD